MILSKSTVGSFGWVYAPSKIAILFAFRTIMASYIALVIALWMELDSPRWAIMAVWVVAQNSSRGEVLSKAYWVICGNIIGIIAVLCIVASFPQQPLLFELAVAVWVSICCWFASYTRNFLAFGWAMAGFSCAIVLFASVNDPNTTFMMSMSRGSYFILGILAENFTARLFDLNIHSQAHKKLNDELQIAVEETVNSVIEMLDGDEWAPEHSDQLLSSIISLNNTIEFREIEMRRVGQTGDYARATLSSISVVLIKAMAFTIHMRQLKHQTFSFNDALPLTKNYLIALLGQLKSGKELTETLAALNSLRWECRQRITDSFYTTLQGADGAETDQENAQKSLNDRILYQSLQEILAELEMALLRLSKSREGKNRERFRFVMKSSPDFRRAWKNAARAFVTVATGCLIWEVTGWQNAPVFLGFLCMGCARFCMVDNISVACLGWVKGICIAILAALFFNFLIMPLISSFEILCLVLFLPLLIGAFAMCVPKYAPTAAAYMFFFCYLLGFENSGRVDEVSFFNNALAVLMSGLVSFIAYRIVFPYHNRRLRQQMRQKLLGGMHRLAKSKALPLAIEWIHFVSNAFVGFMRQLNEEKNTHLIQTYRHGTMGVMLIGINIIRLRAMVHHDIMTKEIKDILRVVLRRISLFDGRKARYGHHARTVLIARRAIVRFRQIEFDEKNLALRIEVSAAIACLTLIADALDKNASFLRIRPLRLLF